jgi:recombination protein RecA
MATAQIDKHQQALEELNKLYGKGTIISGKDYQEQVEVVDSSSLTLNVATGIGGLPVGKLIEIFGPESSGKSTCTLHFIAGFQRAGKRCLLADYEQSFDKGYARNLGVDIDALEIAQPETMEDGYNIIERLIKTGEYGLIILDSHTAMVPKDILAGKVGEAKMALQARINSTGLQKIKPLLLPNNCTMIGISQLRNAIGDYGDPNKPTGGNAWKFYTDMRFKISKKLEKEKENNRTTVEIIKNKCAPPYGKAEFDIIWGEGISRNGEIIDLAEELGVIKRSGSWYSGADGSKLGQGREAVLQLCKDNPGFAVEIESQVLNLIKK